MRTAPPLGLENLQKKLVRVYNAHGLLKKIVVGNERIKYQSYIFQSFEHVSFAGRILEPSISFHLQ